MNCRKTLRALPLFVGGDLDPAAAADVERHVATCDACAAEFSGYTRSRQSLFALKGEPATEPPDLWPSVRLRLGAPPRPRVVPVRAAAAALLVAAGAVFFAWSPGAGTEAPPFVPTPDPAVVQQAPAEAPFESRMSVGPGAFVLAEVGPGTSDDASGNLPAVMPAEPERTGWDEF